MRLMTDVSDLLLPERLDEVRPGLFRPVGTRLDHTAGRHRANVHVRTENKKLVVTLRRSELEIGNLPGLDAG